MSNDRKTMMNKARIVYALAASLFAIPVSAHHSTAAYDYSKEATLKATVVEFQWTNPHMFIKAKVNNTVWNIECGTPNINVRHGWKKTDLKVGDKVTMKIAPMRDGSPGGTLFTIKLADGRTLSGPGVDSKTLGVGQIPS